MSKANFIWAIFLFNIQVAVYAIEGKVVKFDQITTGEGLSNNYCEAILQDSYGFIWIGTNDGLCRYDGHNLKIYKNSPTDSTSIINSFIFSLFEDANKNLWAGTYLGGVAMYNREYDSFVNYTFEAPDSIWQKRNRINEICQTQNYLWFASMYGLGRLNLKTNQTQWFIPNYNEKIEHVPTQVMAILPDTDDNVWVGTLYGGLYYFNGQTEEFERHYIHNPNNSLSISNNKIKDIYLANDGMLWIATEEGGISIMDVQAETFVQKKHDPKVEKSIGTNDIRHFFEDSKGNFWVGTINGGLYLYNYSTDGFQKLNLDNDPSLFDAQSIMDITEDNYGNVWMTTHGEGVKYISAVRNSFVHIRSNSDDAKGLQHNYVSCFYEDEQNNIWVGTDGGGLHLLNKNGLSFESFGTNEGLASNSILDICSAGKNKLSIASWAGGLTIFDTQKKKVIKNYVHHENKNSIGINDVKGVFYDNGKLLLATHGDGYNIFDIETEQFVTWRNNKGLYFDMHFPEWGNQVLKDSKNRVWIATVNGVHVAKGKNLRSYYKVIDDTNSIGGYYVSCIYEDKVGNLWLGTEEGISVFNEAKQNFINLGNKYGLPSGVKAIQQDLNGDYWISSNNGLTKFDYSTTETMSFNEGDGLQGNQFYDRASYMLSTGELLFGGINGFNIFHPDSIVRNQIPPKVYITGFQIFNKQQTPFTNNSPLLKDIMLTNEINLNYNQSVISIEFVGLSFAGQHNIEYSIKLDGFDNNWRFLGKENKVTYTNLNPGNYTLNIKASDSENAWIPQNKSLKLIIKPPWWKTIAFRLFLVVLIVFCILAFYQVRVGQIKRSNKMLAEEVKKQTDNLVKANQNLKEFQQEIISKNEALAERNNELAALNSTKDKFFSIISHDLKNPIGTIMGFTELLIEEKNEHSGEQGQSYIRYIHESAAKMSDLLVNLFEWAQSQTGDIDYNPQMHSIDDIIQNNIELLQTMIKNKEIVVEKNIDKENTVLCDANMINTVIRNLLINAIKFTPRKGKICIQAGVKNKLFEVAITDTGVGMEQHDIELILNSSSKNTTVGTENEKGSGLGLLLCKDFVNVHGGQFKIQSQLGKGSTFAFAIPK